MVPHGMERVRMAHTDPSRLCLCLFLLSSSYASLIYGLRVCLITLRILALSSTLVESLSPMNLCIWCGLEDPRCTVPLMVKGVNIALNCCEVAGLVELSI